MNRKCMNFVLRAQGVQTMRCEPVYCLITLAVNSFDECGIPETARTALGGACWALSDSKEASQ